MSQYTKIDTSDPTTLPRVELGLRKATDTVVTVSNPVLLRCRFRDFDVMTNVVVAVLVYSCDPDGSNPEWAWELLGAEAFGEVAEIKHPIEWRPLPKDDEVVVPEELESCPPRARQLLIDALSNTKWAPANIWKGIINHFKGAKQ